MKRPPSGARDAMEVESGSQQQQPDKETSPSAGEVDSNIGGQSGGQDLNSGAIEPSPLLGKMSAVTSTVIFLYSAAFWIQVGAMPFLSKKLGANPVVFGYLETTFNIAMLVGGPLFGRFGDLFGARSALVVAFSSSFLTYAVLAMANSINALFLSRVCGFMMHAMHGAQMVMTDVSDSKERAATLGRLGVSYGVGMIVGPVVGGYVTTLTSEQSSAAVAAVICLVAIAVVMVFVPRTTKRVTAKEESSKESKAHESHSVFNLRAILSLLKIPALFYVLALKTVVGIPGGVFTAMFTITNMEKFELTPTKNGYLLGYLGVISMLMQGFGISYFSKRYSDNVVLQISIVVTTVSYLLLAFVDDIILLAIILIPMTMSQTLLDTVSSSTITKCVPESETGTALGLNMATRSIIGILAPTTGGYMYSWFGYPSFGLLGFIFNGVMAVYMSIFGGIPL